MLACTPARRSLDAEARDLARRSEQANDALMRGDIDRYRTLVHIGDEFRLMSPFGGEPSRWTDDRRLDALRTYFRNGHLSQDVVNAHVSADLAVLALIEHAHAVEVGGLPAQDWDLRVTLVHRRTGDEWHLVHRHADPLGHAITLDRAAELGRGALSSMSSEQRAGGRSRTWCMTGSVPYCGPVMVSSRRARRWASG